MPHATTTPWRLAPKRTADGTVSTCIKGEDDTITSRHQLRILQTLPLYQLPTELVLQVLRNLDLEDYPAIISATLPLLRRCNIVQNMPTSRLRSLLMENRYSFEESFSETTNQQCDSYMAAFCSHSIRHMSPMYNVLCYLSPLPSQWRGDFDKLPYELRTLIFLQLGTLDKINLVLACCRFTDYDIEQMTHEKV